MQATIDNVADDHTASATARALHVDASNMATVSSPAAVDPADIAEASAEALTEPAAVVAAPAEPALAAALAEPVDVVAAPVATEPNAAEPFPNVVAEETVAAKLVTPENIAAVATAPPTAVPGAYSGSARDFLRDTGCGLCLPKEIRNCRVKCEREGQAGGFCVNPGSYQAHRCCQCNLKSPCRHCLPANMHTCDEACQGRGVCQFPGSKNQLMCCRCTNDRTLTITAAPENGIYDLSVKGWFEQHHVESREAEQRAIKTRADGFYSVQELQFLRKNGLMSLPNDDAETPRDFNLDKDLPMRFLVIVHTAVQSAHRDKMIETQNLKILAKSISADDPADYVFNIVNKEAHDATSTDSFSSLWALGNVRRDLRHLNSTMSDLCTHKHTISELNGTNKYDAFIFLNTGTRGPMDQPGGGTWFQTLERHMRAKPNVALFGTVSCQYLPHVQTHFFVLRASVSDFFVEAMSICDSGFDLEQRIRAAYVAEAMLSEILLRNGHQISDLAAQNESTQTVFYPQEWLGEVTEVDLQCHLYANPGLIDRFGIDLDKDEKKGNLLEIEQLKTHYETYGFKRCKRVSDADLRCYLQRYPPEDKTTYDSFDVLRKHFYYIGLGPYGWDPFCYHTEVPKFPLPMESMAPHKQPGHCAAYKYSNPSVCPQYLSSSQLFFKYGGKLLREKKTPWSVGLEASRLSTVRLEAKDQVPIMCDLDPVSANVAQASSEKVAVLLHLGNPDLWDTLKKYLLNVETATSCAFYISLYRDVADDELVADILQALTTVIILWVENIGMDLGGTFCAFHHMLKNQASHQVFLKLHSKSKPVWRCEVLDPLCGSVSLVRRALAQLEKPGVGMVGSPVWMKFIDVLDTDLIRSYYAPKFGLNVSFYDLMTEAELTKVKDKFPMDVAWYRRYSFNRDLPPNWGPNRITSHYELKGFQEMRIASAAMYKYWESKKLPMFVGGTMFWVKAQPLLSFFKNAPPLDIVRKILHSGEFGYFKDTTKVCGQWITRHAHSWERLWTIMLRQKGLRAVATKGESEQWIGLCKSRKNDADGSGSRDAGGDGKADAISRNPKNIPGLMRGVEFIGLAGVIKMVEQSSPLNCKKMCQADPQCSGLSFYETDICVLSQGQGALRRMWFDGVHSWSKEDPTTCYIYRDVIPLAI
jgi:hypothetical protein